MRHGKHSYLKLINSCCLCVPAKERGEARKRDLMAVLNVSSKTNQTVLIVLLVRIRTQGCRLLKEAKEPGKQSHCQGTVSDWIWKRAPIYALWTIEKENKGVWW